MILSQLKKLIHTTPIQAILVFVATFLIFLPLHIHQSFPDPDSFYHARISTLMDSGPLTEFPWLPLTTLSDFFTDHHLLYHVIIIPFVTVFDPLTGIALATLLFASLLGVCFFLFLKNILKNLTSPFLTSWVLVCLFLLFSHSLFTFRINLAKVPVFSLLLLFAFLWTLYTRRHALLGILSFLYVWAYAAWPIVIIFTVCAAVSKSIITAKKIFHAPSWNIVWISCIGVILGIIIHPSFPSNVGFYWIQIGLIGFLEPQFIPTRVGEWASFGFATIPRLSITLILFILSSVALFIPSKDPWFLKNISPVPRWYQYFLWSSSLIFLLLTFKAIRHAEYFIPLSLLFSGSILIPLVTNRSPWKWICTLFQSTPFPSKKILLLKPLLVLFIPCIIFANIVSVYTQKNGIPFTKFQSASSWLIAHTPKNSIIFHDQWDDFPILFYYNQHNRYISGLHPSFLGIKDQNKLWDTYLIMEGLVPPRIHAHFFDSFGADVIFVNTENKKLLASLDRSPDFIKVYFDFEATIYKKRTL